MAAKKKASRRKRSTKKKGNGRSTTPHSDAREEEDGNGEDDELLEETFDVYRFCRKDINRYINNETRFSTFRAGNLELLRFHAMDMPDQVRALEIELFARRLHVHLCIAEGYMSKVGAERNIRERSQEASTPILDLIQFVAENYTKDER